MFKDLGLVSQVFDEQTLAAMEGHVAIGHCRYSTTGSTTWENAQPVFRNTAAGTGVALGHNGNLVNATELAARAREAGLLGTRGAASRHHRLRHPRRAAGARRRRRHAGAGGAGAAADGARRVLPDVHGREHPVRGPRPLRRAAVVAGTAGPRLGGRLGDRRAGHRRRLVRPRHRAGRAAGHRRRRRALDPVRQPRRRRAASSSTSTWPGRTARSRAGRCTRPASTSAAGWPRSSRSRPTW